MINTFFCVFSASQKEAQGHFQEYWQRLKRIHTADCEAADAGEVFGHPIAEVEARSQVPLSSNTDTDGKINFPFLGGGGMSTRSFELRNEDHIPPPRLDVNITTIAAAPN